MTDSKWFAFKYWLSAKIAELLPDSVKRFVLYELSARTKQENEWTITFEQMYETLKD